MRQLIEHVRWRIAWWRWFLEGPPSLDPKTRRFLPKDRALRRQADRVWRERWKAREPAAPLTTTEK